MINTILVTGGAGFIGSCFVRQWIAEKSSQVIVLDKLTYAGSLESLAEVRDQSNFIFYQGNICDSELITRVLEKHRPSAVINFAAETHVDRSIDGPGKFVETNVVGAFNLLEKSCNYWQSLSTQDKQRFRFLHVSTDEVFGTSSGQERFNEDSRYCPNSPYAASKAASDHFVRAYHQTYGLPTLTTNCSNNYGPFQFPEKFIPLLIINSIQGRPLPIYGDGLQVRDWLHVEDHCRAVDEVLVNGAVGQSYNIGGDCLMTNLEMANAVSQAVDRNIPDLPHAPCSSLIQMVEDRPGHDRRYALDCSKIRRHLDWKPIKDISDGISETVKWYMKNSNWVESVSAGAYNRERLGLSRKTQ